MALSDPAAPAAAPKPFRYLDLNSNEGSNTSRDLLMQLVVGYRPSICINILARLGVADQLSAGPAGIDQIASQSDVDADALYRILRAVSTLGVFEEVEPRRFANSPLSEMLRRDHPDSLRNIALWMADPLHLRCYADLMHSVKTGKTVAQYTLGMPMFEYMRTDPAESAVFHAAMSSITRMFIPSVLEVYDFSGVETVVDVGGGLGAVLTGILEHYPRMKGILFDLDHVIANAAARIEAAGMADRCAMIGGNFFQSVPVGGDAYVLKHIIHDWKDDECQVILQNIRKAMAGRPGSRLLLLEWVIKPGNRPDFAKWADLEMLALPGGRERTAEEYGRLLDSSGLQMTRAIPTRSPASIIEGISKD